MAAGRTYIYKDESGDAYRKCTQLHRNFLALSTPEPRQCLEICGPFPRLEGGGGGRAR